MKRFVPYKAQLELLGRPNFDDKIPMVKSDQEKQVMIVKVVEMSESDSRSKNTGDQLWRFVAFHDYHLPAEPVTHTVKKGLAGFRRLIGKKTNKSTSPLKSADELSSLLDWQLNRIAPYPQWDEAVAALNEELKPWLELDETNLPLAMLVGPPFGGYVDILKGWCDQRNWILIDPPSPQQVMNNDDSWLTENIKKNRPWVLTGLEKIFLRHAEGLSLVRRILDQAYAGKLGRGIMGCNSWAWAYLSCVWHGRMPYTLVLQAFDQDRLSQYLQKAAFNTTGRSFRFRQADNGKCVLPNPEVEENIGEMSSFLQLLAAYSRGNLGVAIDTWRTALRAEPDQVLAEEVEKEERNNSQQTIWVTPWEQLMLPSLPTEAKQSEAFVLHSLLLHNGLSLEWLQQLLPITPNLVMETLIRLKEAGITQQRNEIWEVTRSGYPVVRQFLQSSGYLVDEF